MCKNKNVKFNFYQSDERFFILLCGQHIEVSKDVFYAYKHSVYAQDYNDMLYYNNNITLENREILFSRNSIIKHFLSTEDSYLMKESDREFLMTFKPKIRKTILLWLEGYNDREVAEKIGVSCRYVRQIRAQLRRQFL